MILPILCFIQLFDGLFAGTWILRSMSWLDWITGWITWCAMFLKWPCAFIWRALFRYMCNHQYSGWLSFCRICRYTRHPWIYILNYWRSWFNIYNNKFMKFICETVNNYYSSKISHHWLALFIVNPTAVIEFFNLKMSLLYLSC